MSILTTMQAIQLGMESIRQREDIPAKTKESAIHLLSSLEKADWHRNWTKESVIQALNDYKEETGVAPTVTTLKEYGMPKGVTIRSLFHISPSLFLKRLFPENRKLGHVNPELFNPFGFQTEDDWLNCFIEQFNKHCDEGMTCKRYNVLRDENTPTWDTIARHCGVSTWKALIEKAKVEYSREKIKTASLNEVRLDISSPFLEKLNAINKEKERLQKELMEILASKNS